MRLFNGIFAAILMVGLLVFPACNSTDPLDSNPLITNKIVGLEPMPRTGADTGEWTLLVYIAADNGTDDAAQAVLDILGPIETASAGIRVIALVDRLSPEGTWIYDLSDPTISLAATWDERNTGDASVLAEFVDFGQANYPSQNTLLVIKGPGFGWRGACPDETSGADVMGVHEMAVALEGKNIDLLAFDGSYMGLLEVSYELREVASYLVATQSTITDGGFAYDLLAGSLVARPQISPLELAETMVNNYAAFYESDFATLSACDLSRIGEVGQTFCRVSELLVDQMKDHRTIIAPARDHSEIGLNNAILDSEYLHDLNIFFTDLLAIPDPALQEAINLLLQAFDKAVIAEGHAPRYRSVPHGLSFWFPPSLQRWDCEEVTYGGRFFYDESELDLVAESSWVECLMDYYVSAKRDGHCHMGH